MIKVASCALCGSGDLRPHAFSAATPDALHFAQVRCAGCALIISQPRATSEEIAQYYAQEYYRSHWPDPEKVVAQNQDAYARYEWPLLQELWQDWPPRARGFAVEVGCGYGAFLGMLAKAGYRVAGCDPSADAVRYCRSVGITAIEGVVPGASFEAPAALVVTQHVIEHVEDPRAFVRALSQLAEPGGVVAIVTEDSWCATYAWRVMRARLRRQLPPFQTSTDHTFLFAAHHLRTLLTDAGCVDVRTRSFTYRGVGESLHWRLYKSALRMVNDVAGRGDYLMAVGRLP